MSPGPRARLQLARVQLLRLCMTFDDWRSFENLCWLRSGYDVNYLIRGKAARVFEMLSRSRRMVIMKEQARLGKCGGSQGLKSSQFTQVHSPKQSRESMRRGQPQPSQRVAR